VYPSDVVGSLLRPSYLKDARERHEKGQLSHSEFKSLEDRAVDEAVELQKGAGLAVLTDGEMRRYAFFGHLIDAVEGFDKLGGWAIPFRNEKGDEMVLPRPVVVSKLRRKRPLCAEEFTYLRARTSHPAKTTMISAQQAAAYYDNKKSSGAYPTIDSYLSDLVDILRDEVEELIRLGCTYIQIDSPQYAALLDPQLREGYRQRGNDPDRLLALSPQCGFASTIEGNLVTPADQQAKLRLVAETAKEVWGAPAVTQMRT
jgi:5-methyltetrahydropteroyltriglutamate--homocysteine methyltransferase